MTDFDDRIKLTVENRGSNEWSVKKTRDLASVETLRYCICIYSDMQYKMFSKRKLCTCGLTSLEYLVHLTLIREFLGQSSGAIYGKKLKPCW